MTLLVGITFPQTITNKAPTGKGKRSYKESPFPYLHLATDADVRGYMMIIITTNTIYIYIHINMYICITTIYTDVYMYVCI